MVAYFLPPLAGEPRGFALPGDLPADSAVVPVRHFT